MSAPGQPGSTRLAVVSLFSGAGGMDLGAEQTGLARVVWAVDKDPSAAATYRKNLGDHIWTGDVQKMDWPDVPCDILVAGPPCPDFSLLSSREGLLSERGRLFMSVSKFLHERQPKAFVFENVAGIMSANDGQAYTNVRHALKAPTDFLGLRGTSQHNVRYELAVEVVNCADLGVPQMRKRLIIVGVRRDLGIRPTHVAKAYAGRHVSTEEALARPIAPNVRNHDVITESSDITARLALIPPGGNFENIPAGHPLRVKAMMSHVYRRLDPTKPAFTMIAGGGGGTYGYHFSEPRRLTARELARLQGFPDSFAFDDAEGKAAYPHVRRQIGNAVPPIAAKAILAGLCQQLLDAGIEGAGDQAIDAGRARAVMLNPLTPEAEWTLW